MANRVKSDALHEGDSEDTDPSKAGHVCIMEIQTTKLNTGFKMYIKTEFKI